MIGRLGHICPPRTVAEYIVLAGGGASGATSDPPSGGGGAGGLLHGVLALPRGAAVTVTVGTGAPSASQTNGTNSVLDTLTAIGGGAGGSGGENGSAGGSGGGGGATTSGTTSGGAGTPGQGNPGAGGFVGGAGGGGAIVHYSLITGTAAFYGIVGSLETMPNSGAGGMASFTITGTGIVVEGAGTAAANGTYVPDGTANGKTRYRLGSTDYTLVWLEYAEDFGVWELRDGVIPLYLTDPAGDYPTPTNVDSVAAGASPAPTIYNEITTVASTDGRDGVVIIAYPDTLPPLSVGAGLTYDEPTRAGYRVYRFTSGTGTITP
jgi:hypothetical protein